jgi:hypothetical protein
MAMMHLGDQRRRHIERHGMGIRCHGKSVTEHTRKREPPSNPSVSRSLPADPGSGDQDRRDRRFMAFGPSRSPARLGAGKDPQSRIRIDDCRSSSVLHMHSVMMPHCLPVDQVQLCASDGEWGLYDVAGLPVVADVFAPGQGHVRDSAQAAVAAADATAYLHRRRSQASAVRQAPPNMQAQSHA